MKKWIYILLSMIFLSCNDEGANADLATVNTTDGQGGSLATFALKGDYLYIVDHASLNVFDISEGNIPVQVNRAPIGFEIETLFSHGEHLYIGAQTGMYIYSLENPQLPKQLSAVRHFTACDPVIANDSVAYVTLHSNTLCGNNINVLEMYDIRDQRNPRLLSRQEMAHPKGLGFYEEYIVVCDDQIKIFDVSNGQDAQLVKSIFANAFDVIIQKDLLIAIGEQGVYQYRLSKGNKGVEAIHLSTLQI